MKWQPKPHIHILHIPNPRQPEDPKKPQSATGWQKLNKTIAQLSKNLTVELFGSLCMCVCVCARVCGWALDLDYWWCQLPVAIFW